jgi:heptosyltransferase-1
VRILIVKMSSLGDVVHAQPLATDLRRVFPAAQIHWVVEKPFAPICRLNAAVDEIVPIAWRRWRRKPWSKADRVEMAAFHRSLTREPYDLVLDCQGLIKSAVVTRLARAELRVGPAWAFAREPLASLAYDRKAVVPRDWHVVRRNRAVGAAGGDYRFDWPADFGLKAAVPDHKAAPWLPVQRYALLVTGASRPEKLWPEAHWVLTAQRLQQAGLSLVWFWGTEPERLRAERLSRLAAQAAGDSLMPGVVPTFLTVGDAAGIIAGADIVVGLDTGFTHLGGALGRPTIAIFCDFDAVQCAVSGAGFCASFGGIGQVPPAAEIIDAIERWLATRPVPARQQEKRTP